MPIPNLEARIEQLEKIVGCQALLPYSPLDLMGCMTTMQDAMDAIEPFPVNSVFVAVPDTNPALLLGYGNWTSLGIGRIPTQSSPIVVYLWQRTL